MAHISIERLTVEFAVYESNARSLKNRILAQATGGRIARNARDIVTVRALDDVSLEIENGDRIGLVGHNGSGKTTFLRIIAGIYRPTSGSIEIEGNVGALLNPTAGIDPEASGIENIYLRGYVLGMSKRQINDKINSIAEFTELGDFLHLPVRTYSAGMFSRLGFAISTSINPEILLIDEGVGAGDSRFMNKMTERLQSFAASSSILVLASHDKTLLKRHCTKYLHFENGAVSFQTDLDEIH